MPSSNNLIQSLRSAHDPHFKLEGRVGGLEKGLGIVEKFILDLWQNHIKRSVITQIDAKTKLQEFALKNFKKLPTYKVIANTGPRHKPLFKVGVKPVCATSSRIDEDDR